MTVSTIEILRLKREAAGLSQSLVAAGVGVAPNTLARWERGEMQPHPVFLGIWKRIIEGQSLVSPSGSSISSRK